MKSSLSATIGLTALAIMAVSPLVLASAGDRLPEYSSCSSHCESERCYNTVAAHASVPVLLRAMFWTCFQDCQYQCQQLITAVRVSRGDSVLQFHGKWPFIRLWGMQEPASVLFSLMNLIPHAVGYTVLKQHPSSHEGMKKYYKGFALVGANTWIWSAIFHTRDFVLTERLDYFSAALTMMVSFFVCAIRMFSLAGPQQKKARYALALVCSFLYLSHVSYLSLVKFSYSYNMAANVAVGLIQTLMWTIFSLREYIRTKRLSALVPLATVWSITAASSLELFDFPPWWYIVDAHSLWHLATVLPTTWWYRWMTIDLTAEATEGRFESNKIDSLTLDSAPIAKSSTTDTRSATKRTKGYF